MAEWDRLLLEHLSLGVVVSHRDRNAIAAGQASLAEKIAVVPFGVAVADHPLRSRPAQGVVLISGNLGYFPTVDGAKWFGSEVWPRLRAAESGAVWWLAGSRPARAVQRLVRLPGVSLFRDPHDLAAFVGAATVSVAPMRSGSGTPIKVLEAMASGVPVVATPFAAEGLDGVPAGALAVAEGPDAFAASVTRLLSDPEHAARQAAAAWEWVRSRHSLEAVAAAFEEILARAAASRG
jgi:glycosyltransferase involved in cell wall biosynthesis